jgi:hypothetical protein
VSVALAIRDQVSGDEIGVRDPVAADRAPDDAVDIGDPEAVELSVASLTLGPSPRKTGVVPEHVRVLAQLDGHWPPLLVNRADLTIIDGAHRFHAARMLGYRQVWCVYFDGDREEAFLEAIRRNTRHGLPLTLREREDAAAQLLGLHREWSNRRVAESCALAHGTVAKIREQLCSSGEAEQLNKRVGRDGRIRPVDSAETRKSIERALESAPGATARQIAAQVGASPTTVATVRSRMKQAAAGAEALLIPGSAYASGTSGRVQAVEQPGAVPSASEALGNWRSDVSLSSTPEQKLFLAWFEKTSIQEEWTEFVDVPPLSRVYELADEARRRAQYWEKFAQAIEFRSSPSRGR